MHHMLCPFTPLPPPETYGSIIVYVMTRKEAEQAADVLNKQLGVRAAYYHGGMPDAVSTRHTYFSYTTTRKGRQSLSHGALSHVLSKFMQWQCLSCCPKWHAFAAHVPSASIVRILPPLQSFKLNVQEAA